MVTAARQEQPSTELDNRPLNRSWLEPLQILWDWRHLLWKTTVLAFLVSLLIAFLIPKQYESTTRLMPPDSQSISTAGMASAVMGTLPNAATGVGANILGLRSQGALFTGVLQSRTVADYLINQFDLRKVYSYKRYIDARKKLARRTSIAEDTKSGIITVTVMDNDPGRARGLATAYVDELNNLVAQVSTSSARRERIFLEERLSKVKQELDEATLRLGKFSSKNMTFDPELQGRAMLDAASTLQGELIAQEAELNGLEQIYGPENARVKAGSARVSELRSKLRSMSGRGGKDQAGSASLTPSELYPSLEQLPLLGNTYIDLARRAKIDEAVYEVLTRQYELAKVEEAKEIPTVKILDPADLPESKSFPPRLLIGISGSFLSFVVAASFLFLRRLWLGLNPDDPNKLFLQGVLRNLSWPSRLGSRVG